MLCSVMWCAFTGCTGSDRRPGVSRMYREKLKGKIENVPQGGVPHWLRTTDLGNISDDVKDDLNIEKQEISILQAILLQSN